MGSSYSRACDRQGRCHFTHSPSRYALEELSFFEEFRRSLAWVSKCFFFSCHVKGRKLGWVRVGIWHPIIKGHVKFRGWSRPKGSFKCGTKTSKRSCKPDSGSFARFLWLSRAGGVLVALLVPFSRPCLRKSYLNDRENFLSSWVTEECACTCICLCVYVCTRTSIFFSFLHRSCVPKNAPVTISLVFLLNVIAFFDMHFRLPLRIC